MALIQTETKLGTLNYQDSLNQYLHSNFDPYKESERLLNSLEKKSEVLVCFGVGVAYFLEILLKQILVFPYTKIFAIEPELELKDIEELKKKYQFFNLHSSQKK